MVFLCHDYHPLRAEDVPRPQHRLLGREPGVVTEDILCRHSCRQAVAQHHVYLVMPVRPVVPGQKDLRGRARLIERDPGVEPVPEHVGRGLGILYAAAQDQDAVGAEGFDLSECLIRDPRLRAFVFKCHISPACPCDVQVDREHAGRSDHRDRDDRKKKSLNKTDHLYSLCFCKCNFPMLQSSHEEVYHFHRKTV